MLADALGRPLRLILTGGQVHDIVTAPALLAGIHGGAVIADKAYDSNHLRQLKAADSVEGEPCGRYTYYRLAPEALEAMSEQFAGLARAARVAPKRPC